MPGDELRQQFVLPEEDAEHLSVRQVPWETVQENQSQWVLVHQFPVPPGYNVSSTTAAVQILPNYPTTHIDMVYFRPALALSNGRSIPNLSSMVIAGEEYQRWSRHRTAENPWRPGLDCLESHLSLVEEWLLREIK